MSETNEKNEPNMGEQGFESSINGRAVLRSGQIVASKGEVVEIYPFCDRKDEYTLRFRFKSADGKTSPTIAIVPDKSNQSLTYIDVSLSFLSGTFVMNGTRSFASDGTNEYYLKIAITLVGNDDSYSFISSYTISQAAAS